MAIENYIEDCVMFLAREGVHLFEEGEPPVTSRDKDIVHSLGRQLANGNAFTEKQSHIGLRLVNKYSSYLKESGYDIIKLLEESPFKWPFRKLDSTKRLYIEDDKIVIKSPFIAEVINKIKKRKGGSHFKGEYRPNTKEWSFDYNESNVMFLYELIVGYNTFDIEQKIKDDYNKCIEICKDYEQHLPMLKGKDIQGDVREAVMQARMNGIGVFDDDVVALMNQNPTKVDKVLLSDNHFWHINLMKYNILDVFPLIKSASSCIIMCAGSEFNTLKMWIDTLTKHGINSSDISVCYRFKDADAEGNEYIRNKGVNKFDPNNKIFFINEKVPKPLISNNINPDVVIYTMSTQPGHYKTRNWLSSKPLVAYYSPSVPSGVENCANL